MAAFLVHNIMRKIITKICCDRTDKHVCASLPYIGYNSIETVKTV